MQRNVYQSQPPWQPLLPQEVLQSTNCCYDNDTFRPFWIKYALYKAAIEQNAQHEAHIFWFFTGVTLPSLYQSIQISYSLRLSEIDEGDQLGVTISPRYDNLNYYRVRSAKELIQRVKVCFFWALWLLMSQLLAINIFWRQKVSPGRQVFPYF